MPNGLFGFPKAFNGTGANGLYGFPQGQLGAVQLGYVPPANGLTLWLRKSDPGTGTTWSDSSGYTGAGTLRTGATWLNGNSVAFDGGTTCSVDGFAVPILPIGERSIIVIATSIDNTFARRGILGTRGAGASSGGYALGYFSATSFQYYQAGGITYRPTITMPAVNTRNMWVVTHAAPSTVALYLNGVAVASDNTLAVSSVIDTTFNGRIGGEQNAGTTENWKGSVEQVLSYNRAISAAEVTDLYTNLF